MKNLQVILDAILSKNIFNYIMIDKNLNIVSASEGISKYLLDIPKQGDDVLQYLPELVGNEKEIKSVFTKKYCLFSLESIYKNEYYLDLTIEYCDNKLAIILLHNITASVLATRELQQYFNEASLLNSTLEKVVNNQPTILFVVDEKEQIVFANQRCIDYFEAKDIDGLNAMELNLYKNYDDKLQSYDELYQRIYKEESPVTIGNETFIMDANQIETTHKLFTLLKVTEIHKKKKNLETEAQFDDLTQVYRKSYFDILLNKELLEGATFAIVVIDIDDFKSINDVYGHVSGDTALKEFTTLLKKHLRQDDVLARWGGEEFLILLKRTDGENALDKVEELRKKVDSHVFSNIGNMKASFGVTCVEDNDNINTLLLRADKALYQAKSNGKNSVVLKKK